MNSRNMYSLGLQLGSQNTPLDKSIYGCDIYFICPKGAGSKSLRVYGGLLQERVCDVTTHCCGGGDEHGLHSQCHND